MYIFIYGNTQTGKSYFANHLKHLVNLKSRLYVYDDVTKQAVQDLISRRQTNERDYDIIIVNGPMSLIVNAARTMQKYTQLPVVVMEARNDLLDI